VTGPGPGELAQQKAAARAALRAAERDRATRPGGAELVRSLSHRACAALLYSPFFLPVRTVMVYSALPGEADPEKIAVQALASDKHVAYPRTDWAARSLVPAQVVRLEDGPDGLLPARDPRAAALGLREPGPDCPELDPGDLDLVIVPGLGFDAAGNRLGRGAGFYDRFLGALSPRVMTVGLCFAEAFMPAQPGLPHGPRDIPVRAVATEAGLTMIRGPEHVPNP